VMIDATRIFVRKDGNVVMALFGGLPGTDSERVEMFRMAINLEHFHRLTDAMMRMTNETKKIIEKAAKP